MSLNYGINCNQYSQSFIFPGLNLQTPFYLEEEDDDECDENDDHDEGE